jgi:hypothetical protein
MNHFMLTVVLAGAYSFSGQLFADQVKPGHPAAVAGQSSLRALRPVTPLPGTNRPNNRAATNSLPKSAPLAPNWTLILTNHPGRGTNVSTALLPGVYETAPYTCIVVVPEKHVDDSIFVAPTESVTRMPVVKPELQFIPLSKK